MSVSWRRCQTLGNQVFGSAHPMWIASRPAVTPAYPRRLCLSTSRADCINLFRKMAAGVHLCLSTSRADCIQPRIWAATWTSSLPQHIPCGLHPRAADQQKQTNILCLSTSRADCIRAFAPFQDNPIALPQHIPCGLHRHRGHGQLRVAGLCLSTSRADCIHLFLDAVLVLGALPQHIPCGLHQQ